MKHPPGEPMPSLRSGQGGGGFIDGDIPWTFIFYIVRLIGARGLRPHMTLSCHPLFAPHGPKIDSTVKYMVLRQVNMVNIFFIVRLTEAHFFAAPGVPIFLLAIFFGPH